MRPRPYARCLRTIIKNPLMIKWEMSLKAYCKEFKTRRSPIWTCSSPMSAAMITARMVKTASLALLGRGLANTAGCWWGSALNPGLARLGCRGSSISFRLMYQRTRIIKATEIRDILAFATSLPRTANVIQCTYLSAFLSFAHYNEGV